MRNKRERENYSDAKVAYAALMKFYPTTVETLANEQWRSFAPDYQISNFGRVKSFKKKYAQILKPTLHTGGYLVIKLQIDCKQRTFYIHRLVAENFITNLGTKSHVNHLDGNKLNNFVENLEWVTPSENNQHAVKVGLIKSGGEDCRAVTTDEIAAEIRKVFTPYDEQFGLTALSKRFNLSLATVFRIVHGERYKTAEGFIHSKKAQRAHTRLPEEICMEICRDYKPRDKKYGVRALASKYGVHRETIRKIIIRTQK